MKIGRPPVPMLGRRFGQLVVLSQDDTRRDDGTLKWLCQCDCGKQKVIAGTDLRAKKGAGVGTLSCGHLSGRDPVSMVGRVFGHLKVIKFADTRNNRGIYNWLCECSCGVTKSINGSVLRNGSTISCGHVISEIRATTRFCKKLPPGESSKRKALRAMRDSAHARSIVMKLDNADLLRLSQQLCAYCGKRPSNCSRTETGAFYWNGLDRVDNKGIYTLDNVVTCCKHCNYSKGNRTREDFLNWAKRIAARH